MDPTSGEPIWSVPWTATECRQVAGALPATAGYVNENLPEPYQSSGGSTATLVLLVQTCEALVMGNQTLVEPFGLLFLYAFVQQTNETINRPEAFVFETVVTDATVAAALEDYGWPVDLGTIAIQEDIALLTFLVETDHLSYQATLVREPFFPEVLQDNAFLFHAGPPDTSNLLYDSRTLVDDGFADPGFMMANGGVLGAALPFSGAGPYIPELTVKNTRLVFI